MIIFYIRGKEFNITYLTKLYYCFTQEKLHGILNTIFKLSITP